MITFMSIPILVYLQSKSKQVIALCEQSKEYIIT